MVTNSSDYNLEHCLAVSGNSADTWATEAKFWAELILLTLLNILVIVGNIFVLLALVIDRQLRNPTHYFICSLALADLTLGIFVLPFAAVFQMRGVWIFGSVFCQIWLLADIVLCTASIYSLVSVTLDRYIAVTKPLTYKSVMTHRRACGLIVAVWTVSFIVCLPAFAISLHRTAALASITCVCTQMAHSPLYIAYSSTGSFYLPMIVILYLYAKIYATVRRIRLSGNSGVVLTSPSRKSRKRNRNRTPSKRRHATLMEKGRQLSAVLRVHKGGYNPARKISSGLSRLSANFRQRQAPVRVVEETIPMHTDAESSRPNDIVCESLQSENGRNHLSLNFSAKRFLAASCPSSSTNSPRASMSLSPEITLCSTRRNSASSAALGHEVLLHLAMPSQLTTVWCQRMVALQRYQKKFSLELKALKTVGIVTGCFFLSWLGFCIVYTMQALPSCRPAKSILTDYFTLTTSASESQSEMTTWISSSSPSYSSIDSCVPDWVVNLMVWLGYVNSAMNPIIYGISNQQFRRTFRRIMRCEFLRCCDNEFA